MEVQEPEPRHPWRQIGYFDIHPDSSTVMKANSADSHRQPSDIEPSRDEVTPLTESIHPGRRHPLRPNMLPPNSGWNAFNPIPLLRLPRRRV